MTMHNGTMSWFLAQLKPNCAGIADRNLKRQGFQTFLPLEEVTRKRNGKFVSAMRPLFPGYIFIAFDVDNGHWNAINSTHGVTRLVRFGPKPMAIPHELITMLMTRCDKESKLQTPLPFNPGDKVTLTHGPFTDFVAEVEQIAPDQRIWVLMEIMGAETRVEVGANQLRAD